jgi:hypothetical protein
MKGDLLFHFSLFVIIVALGSYVGNINSSLLGIDLTTADESVVGLIRIGVYGLGFSVLLRGVKK